jgi:RNase P/RNase MRP subunit POP5
MATKSNSWHPDYAAEFVLRQERQAFPETHSAGLMATTFEVRPLLRSLADEIGSEKLAAIVATVADIEDQREAQGIRCRRKVSDKQRMALATALLEKYGSTRNIAKAAWGLTDEQINSADA